MATPVDPAFVEQMNALARELDERFNGVRLPGLAGPKKVGFCLLAFKFDDFAEGQVNYISNANREDMLAALKSYLGRMEGRVTGEEPGLQ